MAPAPQAEDDGEAAPPLEAEGVHPIHPSVSLAPFENIDLTSGNLAILIPLLRMPGDGLLDLSVTLSFNSKHWTWRIGPGSILRSDHGSPMVISDDGTTHELALLLGSSTEFITADFWRYSRTTHLLRKPNGVVVRYDRCDPVANLCRPSLETDQFGNTISYNYATDSSGSPLTSIVQSLGEGRQRVVTFSYDPGTGHLQTLSYRSATWTFDWTDATNLHRVTLPTHGAWTFDRTHSETGQDRLLVTAPTGGIVEYEMTRLWCDFRSSWSGRSGYKVYRRFLTSRRTSGSQLEAGTWTLGYGGPGGSSVGLERYLHDPDGTTTSFTLELATGVAVGRSVTAGGASIPMETEAIALADLEQMVIGAGADADMTVPLIHGKTIVRQGATYRTEYVYGLRDAELWADFGQPRRITTYGDFTRTTAIAYRHDFGPLYIRGKVASVTVEPDGPDPVTSSALYDDQGFMTSKTEEGITTTYERDTQGNLSQVKDAEQKWRQYDHAWGRTSEVRTPLYTIKNHFTSAGTIDWTARDSAGGDFVRQTLFQHGDALERETVRTPPVALPSPGLPTATDYAHEADAVMESDPEGTGPFIETSRGTTSARTYLDGYGRTRRAVVNPPEPNEAPTITTTRYDALGRKVFESLPFTETEVGTSYTYDAIGRITSKTLAGKTTTYSYSRSAGGSTVTITEPFAQGARRTTVQTWQSSGGPDGGRLIRVHDALGNETTYTYTVVDKLTTVQTPGILSREYHYIPGTSRLAYEIHPECGRTDYTYYANGLVHTRTDALGRVVTFTYDAVNRVTKEEAAADTAYTTTTSYDDPRSDQPLTVTNGYVSSVFAYDSAARLTARTDAIHVTVGDAGRAFTTLYGPDGYDTVSQITYPSGRVVNDDFNDQRHVTSVTDGVRTYASGIQYHPSGQIADITSGNGVPTSVSFDRQTYWPTSVVHGTSGAVLNLAYASSDDGNVRTIADARPGMNVDLTDGYDPVDRLIRAVGPWGTLTYLYDAVGNRVGRTQANETTAYRYDVAGHNRLATTTVGGGVTEGFIYNDVGQLVVDGRGVYNYTPAGMLETAQMGSGLTVTHRYDGGGMRAAKVVGGIPHYYVHGPGGQLLAEYEEAGGQLAWVVDYVYAGSRLLAAVRPDVSYPVTVAKTGSGRVTGDPAGVDCGDACSAAYPAERAVTLMAVPDAGSGFTGWGGSCSGRSPTITLTVTAAASCTATFSSSPTLLVTASGSGSGTVGFSPAGTSCGPGCATFGANTEVTLTATPATDSVFAGWSGDADCADGRVTMDRAKGCTGVFTRREGVAVTKIGSGAGTVTSVPGGIACGAACAGAFAPGSVVTLTAVPDAGSRFTGWSGDSDCGDGTLLLTAARSCLARFELDPPQAAILTVVKTGEGAEGSAVTSSPAGIECGTTCAASFSSGTTVHLTGEPAPGYEFVVWQGTGCATGTVVLDQARSCTAVFQALPCDPYGDQRGQCEGGGGRWDDETCSCQPLWVDANHDGVSQPEELSSLEAAGIASIELASQPIGRRDGLGNVYRYRGRVHLQSGRTVPIWDVFLATRNAEGGSGVPGCVQSADPPSTSGSGGAPETGPVADDANASPAWTATVEASDAPPVGERVEFYHLDVLGSVRVVTDAEGRVLARHDFLPFGEEWVALGGAPGANPADKKLFTGQERDAELGLDYFGARYYRATLGGSRRSTR